MEPFNKPITPQDLIATGLSPEWVDLAGRIATKMWRDAQHRERARKKLDKGIVGG